MAQNIIKINVADKIATTQFEEVVSFNQNTYELQFTFDTEWNAFEHRIAVVMWAGGCAEAHFTGTTCEMPAITDPDCDMAFVGVYSADGDHKIASTFVRLKCLVGAHEVLVPKRQASIQEQILSFLNLFDWSVFEKKVRAGVYSTVKVNPFGIVTEGWNLIEIGEEGQTSPSANLATGGIFFRLQNGVYTLNYKTSSGLQPISFATAAGVTSVNGQTGAVTIGASDLGLANVALSGSYNDLTDLPEISGGTGAVSSVNGQTGAVTIGASDLGLADVALSGSYNDLTDLPTIPSGGVTSVNGQTGAVTIGASNLGLADVALSGSYNDLTDLPEITSGGVTSVNGQTGAVMVTKTAIGLGHVIDARQIQMETKITYGAELNDYYDTRLTYVQGRSSDACTHVPTSTANPSGTNCQWAILNIAFEDYEDNMMQVAFSVRNDCAICVRNCTNGVWTNWKKLTMS